jgi:hypothetical protein
MKFAAALIMLALLLGGCAATVITPLASNDSVPVYLTNYGRHSSVLIPTSPEHFNEYAYGDFNWFALNQLSLGNALQAMLFSRGPTLGRRQLVVKDDIDAVALATGALTVNRFHVRRDKAEQLVARLDEKFTAHLNTVTFNSLSQMWFVRAGPHYSVAHNCNHATANWLEALGCDVRGFVMFSNFKIRPRPQKTPATIRASH